MARGVLLSCVMAQAAAAQILSGVIDFHVHSDPDSVARSIDAISLARIARQRGIRALVLKNHYESTAGLAWLVRNEVPGIEAYGGIALNRSVGGVNPAAVERMTLVKGSYGRVVWLPTFDAENNVSVFKENRPSVPVSRNGRLLPQVLEVLALIAKKKLVLATGHSSARENLLLIAQARKLGINRIIVTHPLGPPVNMTRDQMKEAASAGAYLEFTCVALIDQVGANKAGVVSYKDYVEVIRAVGPQHVIVTSDLGQAGNPLHPDGMERALRGLMAAGLDAAEIDMMTKKNPARLLE